MKKQMIWGIIGVLIVSLLLGACNPQISNEIEDTTGIVEDYEDEGVSSEEEIGIVEDSEDEGASPEASNAEKPTATEEESQEIALAFLMESPTFQFDGVTSSIELVDTYPARCPYCWTFVYEFDCTHSGYGDRTDQMLLQVITHHTASINMSRGNVTHASIDNTWDMCMHTLMATEEESQLTALEFVENCPTYLFDGIEGSIKLVETLDAFCPYCWGFVYEFECRQAGYGDRTGMMLAQVITTHRAVVSMSGGQIDGGTIDDEWNMITQEEYAKPEVTEAISGN